MLTPLFCCDGRYKDLMFSIYREYCRDYSPNGGLYSLYFARHNSSSLALFPLPTYNAIAITCQKLNEVQKINFDVTSAFMSPEMS